MTFPWERRRVRPDISETDVLNVQTGGPFTYHLGDVFTPGASGWAIDMPVPGLMLQSIFGRGGVASVCCRKYSWDMRAQQLENNPTVRLVNPTNGGAPLGTFGLTSLIPDRSAAL